jgi:PAS domain S-box-containing protein
MDLPTNLRSEIADRIIRVVAPVVFFGMVINMIGIFLFGGHQYQRLVGAAVVIILVIPAWVSARRGRPLTGVVFLVACFCLAVLTGMTVSGGVYSLSYTTTLVIITIFIVLYGARGGIAFALFTVFVGVLFSILIQHGILHRVAEPPVAFQMFFHAILLTMQFFFVLVPVQLLFKALTESQHQSTELKKTMDELKQTEERLQKSEQKYRSIFENIQDVYAEVAPDGTILEVSPSITRFSGYRREEIIGRSLADFYNDPAEFKALWDRLRFLNHVNDYEVRMHNSDGGVLVCSITVKAVPQTSGAIEKVVGTVRDITDRKRFEEKLLRVKESLKAENQRKKILMDTSRDGIAIINQDHKVVEANRRFAEMLGYTFEEVHNLHTWDFEAFMDESQIRSRFGDLTKTSSTFQTKYRRKDGTLYDVEVCATGALVFDEPMVMAICRDITERKQVEEALKKKMIALTRPLDNPEGIAFEDLFNLNDIQRLQDQFAKATGVASIITNPDGTPITKPSNFCRLCSEIIRNTEKGLLNCCKSDAVIGRPSLEGATIQPCLSGGLWDAGAAISVGGKHIASWLIGQVRDASQTDEKIRAYAREIGADEHEAVEAFHEVLPMSREQFEVVSQTLFTLANQFSSVAYQNIQQARFINDMEQAKEELRSSQERIQAILEASPDPVVVYDELGCTTFLNPAFVSLFGWSSEEFLGRRIPFVPEDQKEANQAAVDKLLQSGGKVSLETKRFTKDGRQLDVLASAAAILNEHGQAAGIVVNLTDLSIIKKMETQLIQAQKMESVGRLAGGVAHDFNNMLSVILGYSELAMQQAKPNKAVHDALKEIQKAAQRSADVTRQLLGFARKQTIEPKVIDLNKTVESMLKMLRRLIGEDIDLVWQPTTDLWTVMVDPSQIDQIMVNLCVNARDAITGVGKIIIETNNVAIDESYCENYPYFVPGNFILITVSDDGCGMDKQTMSEIFDPFFTTKEADMGTGLGLATVYGIVKQNNGYINVYSEPHHGTTFKIFLPRHEIALSSLQKKSSKVTYARGNETILLVEDESSILEMTTMMLERLGYTVLIAQTPGKAIQIVHQYTDQIHLLMTDVVLPEMDGRKLSQKLLAVHPKLKCLFMSGYTANVIALRAVIENGMKLLRKPFSIEQLDAKVREALDDEKSENQQ